MYILISSFFPFPFFTSVIRSCLVHIYSIIIASIFAWPKLFYLPYSYCALLNGHVYSSHKTNCVAHKLVMCGIIAYWVTTYNLSIQRECRQSCNATVLRQSHQTALLLWPLPGLHVNCDLFCFYAVVATFYSRFHISSHIKHDKIRHVGLLLSEVYLI